MEEYRRLILNSDSIEAAENWNDGIVHLADLGDIYIHVTQNKEQTFGISSILDDLEPENIIIFEVNLDILRQIEAYKARRPSLPCKVRFENVGGHNKLYRGEPVGKGGTTSLVSCQCTLSRSGYRVAVLLVFDCN